MESKLGGKVHYLQFVDCTFDAAKQNDELQDRPPQCMRKHIWVYLYTKTTPKDK